jgi:hypothetical protein
MSLIHYSTKHLDFRPKLKICLFPAPDRPLENVATRNIFLRDLRWFGFFLVTGNRDQKFRYCSRFTFGTGLHFEHNEQNPLLDFEGTRFVNEHSLFWKKKKNPPTYRPIGEMEVRETNILLRVASQRQLENMVKFMEFISIEMNMLFLDQSTIQRSIYYLDPLQDIICG